ncbi:MAG: pentapeptide repeat-containing protein [Victivallales bacterium]
MNLPNDIKKISLPTKYLDEITDIPEGLVMDDCLIERKAFLKCSFSPDIQVEGMELFQNLFAKCTLDNVRILNAWFKNNRFDNCSMPNANFKRSRFEQAEFKMSKLLGMSFEACSGTNILFIGSNCQFADFRETTFRKTFFNDCNLREADFQGANLCEVTFNNCDLREAQFSFAQLNGTNFCSSRIEGIKVQPESLRGAVVDYHQSAYLGAKLLKLNIV